MSVIKRTRPTTETDQTRLRTEPQEEPFGPTQERRAGPLWTLQVHGRRTQSNQGTLLRVGTPCLRNGIMALDPTPCCPRFTVSGPRFTVHGSRFTVHGSRFTVHGSRFTVHGSRFTVQSTGCAWSAADASGPYRESAAPYTVRFTTDRTAFCLVHTGYWLSKQQNTPRRSTPHLTPHI